MSEWLENIKDQYTSADRFLNHRGNESVEVTTNVMDKLIKQAELNDHYKDQIDITQRRNEKLEEELMTAHAPIGHLEQENEQLREALRDIVLNYKVVMDGSQDEGYDFVEDVYDTARQALGEDNNG